MNSLAQIVQAALGEQSVQKGADKCGIAHHVLRDIIGGQSLRPRPEHLKAIAKGLGIPYNKLVLSAYEQPAASGARKTAKAGGAT